MAEGIHMQFAGRTDVGLIREHNEDNLLVVNLDARAVEKLDGPRRMQVGPRGALLMVCDGMGGAAAGEVASQMAVEIVASLLIERHVEPPDDKNGDRSGPLTTRFARRLRQVTFEANRRIHEASRSDDERQGMGTTLTGVGVIGQQLVMTQVGDSRAYVLRGGVLTQVTRDQSLVNQLLETGQITEEQARMFEHSNVILQALGVQEDVEILLSQVALRRGDRVVVCTDGLTGVVTDEEVALVLGGTDDMDEVCRLLVEMARAAGGPDNITVVAASFDGDNLPEPAEADKVAYERWRLDEADAPPEPHPAHPSNETWPAVQRRRDDPARTFFSLMVLLALTLGGFVTAGLIRGSPGSLVKCQLVASPGQSIHVDGRDVGQKTRIGETAIKLPPGHHRVALRPRGSRGPGEERAVEVAPGSDCRIRFEENQ